MKYTLHASRSVLGPYCESRTGLWLYLSAAICVTAGLEEHRAVVTMQPAAGADVCVCVCVMYALHYLGIQVARYSAYSQPQHYQLRGSLLGLQLRASEGRLTKALWRCSVISSRGLDGVN